MSVDEIVVLEAREAIRTRPAMYVGDPSSSETIPRIILETLCLAVRHDDGPDDAARVRITFEPRSVVRVDHDGVALPITPMPGQTISAVEAIMTKLHSCRAAKKRREDQRLCNDGVVVVNALSSWCTIRVRREGHTWEQRYRRGTPTTKLVKIARTARTGTELRFCFDRSIIKARLDREVFDRQLEAWRRLAPCVDVRVAPH